MKEFKDKVAVITGAASGIGRGIAEKCVKEQMKVVLSDIENPALEQAEHELKSAGATVMAVRTDVSQNRDIEELAQKTLDKFGAVHLLFNNAGVGAGSSAWETTLADWEWVVGVNLWGVIHGSRVFIPIMLKQNVECHIVNTASTSGLFSGSPSAYFTTKHGVVAFSESLHLDLAKQDAKIKISVLCPGYVNTRISDSTRNRPGGKDSPSGSPILNPEMLALARQLIQSGMSPQDVAEKVFNAIREEKLYILTHPEWKPMIQQRMDNILQERNPSVLGLQGS